MSQRTADRTGEGVRGDIAGEEWWMEPSTQCVLGDQMSNDGELGTRPKARADNRSRGIPRGQRGTTDFHMPLLRIHRCLMSPNPVRRSTCTSYKVRYGHVPSNAGRTRGTKPHCYCCYCRVKGRLPHGQASPRRLQRPQRAGMPRREWRRGVPGTREAASLAEKQKRPRCDSSPQCLNHSGRPLALGKRPIDGLRTKTRGLDDRQHPSA
jgi:hypothetical protein